MATLAVQEAMGLKVDREAVATLVLPQLWTMSMGPRESIACPISVHACSSVQCSADCLPIQTVHGRDQEAG